MDPFTSFFFGPYCLAFAIMDEYQFLPTPESFTEFTEEMYEEYFEELGMPAERMFQMNPGPQYKGGTILSVSKTEMQEILKAKQFVDDEVMKEPKMKDASDLEKIDYFKSQFTFFFPDKNNDEK